MCPPSFVRATPVAHCATRYSYSATDYHLGAPVPSIHLPRSKVRSDSDSNHSSTLNLLHKQVWRTLPYHRFKNEKAWVKSLLPTNRPTCSRNQIIKIAIGRLHSMAVLFCPAHHPNSKLLQQIWKTKNPHGTLASNPCPCHTKSPSFSQLLASKCSLKSVHGFHSSAFGANSFDNRNQAQLGAVLAPLHIIGDGIDVSDPGKLSWLVAGYSLTVGIFVLPSGRLGDIYGHRRLFFFGAGILAFFSLLLGFSVVRLPLHVDHALTNVSECSVCERSSVLWYHEGAPRHVSVP